MGLIRVTAPEAEPVELDQARLQVRADGDNEDDLIEAYLLAAREYVETYTGLALIDQEWEQTADSLDEEIVLRKRPVKSVASVKYFDTNNVEQTLDSGSYRLVKRDSGDQVLISTGVAWPVAYPIEGSVTVRFISGFGDAAESVPAAMKQAIKLLVAHWFANREAVSAKSEPKEVPMGVEALLFPHRVFY